MKLFVLGANGRTGTEVIDIALARGHHVTAFVRDAHRVTRTHERLKVMVGDALNTESIAAALPGHDAVVSALGIKSRQLFSTVTLVQEGAASTVAAMTRAGVKRLVLVSAATLFDDSRAIVKFVRWVLRRQVADLIEAERIIGASELEWTFARPPSLSSGVNEKWRSEVGRLPDKAWSMTFRAVAAFMVDALERNAHVREVVGLAS
ncbi:MAG: NAD(P)H-binding protein [Archangium sp.]